VREQVMEEVRRAFRPEFLNRLDEILLFNRLSRANMTDIVEVQLAQAEEAAGGSQDHADVRRQGAAVADQPRLRPVYGARPLEAGDPAQPTERAGDAALEGKIRDGDTVDIGVQNGELNVGGQQVLSEAAD
jgi:ATP-dependent Clp protease ATP-binding subunit ClpB